MAHRALLVECVKVRLELFGVELVITGQPQRCVACCIGCRVAALRDAVNLGAIASRENCRLAREAAVEKFAQGSMQTLNPKHHLLAHLQGRGVVVDAEGGQMHGA